MRRGAWVLAVATVPALGLAGCGGDQPAGNGSGYAAPADDFCGDVIDTALPRPGQGIVDPWIGGGDVRSDAVATTATCTFTGGDHQVELLVVVGDGVEVRYDELLDELEAGAVGFEHPEVSTIRGWWSDGRRFEPAAIPVRIADVLRGEDALVRIRVVEFGGARGKVAPRRKRAAKLAEKVTAVVPEVLGRE